MYKRVFVCGGVKESLHAVLKHSPRKEEVDEVEDVI